MDMYKFSDAEIKLFAAALLTISATSPADPADPTNVYLATYEDLFGLVSATEFAHAIYRIAGAMEEFVGDDGETSVVVDEESATIQICVATGSREEI